MILHRVQHDLRYLCSGSVIDENKIVATVQRRKGTANPCDPESGAAALLLLKLLIDHLGVVVA
jgi:hypothetical protein